MMNQTDKIAGLGLATETENPVPYALLSPPEGITPAQTRGAFQWSFPPHQDPSPNLPGRLPRMTWTPQERKAYEARVQWFHAAKYGIFFHYLSAGEWAPEEWDAWVDAVDVIRGGGVFTFDLGTFKEGCFEQLPTACPTGRKPDGSRIGPFLEIQPDQFAILEAVRDAVKNIPPSDGKL